MEVVSGSNKWRHLSADKTPESGDGGACSLKNNLISIGNPSKGGGMNSVSSKPLLVTGQNQHQRSTSRLGGR